MLKLGGGRPSIDDALPALLSGETALLLAVSGGPDSVALMLLAAQWLGRPRTEIATVDHGLRPDSRAEAEAVGDLARQLGFTHHLLVWEGEKPGARIQEKAREARYALLCGCAREIDPDCAVVTAHHADDQAETTLFRLTRGSGVAGLAGMAAETRRNGQRLLRPLLDADKAALIALCDAAGAPYVRDPSNENAAFARARLRRLGATLAEEGLDKEALLRLSARAARAEAALDWAALGLGDEARRGEATYDAGTLAAAPVELLQRIMAMEIHRLSPGGQLRLERLERAAARLAAALATRARLKLTLGPALFLAEGAALVVSRAPPRRGAAAAHSVNLDEN